jgi:MscS family membrane protein
MLPLGPWELALPDTLASIPQPVLLAALYLGFWWLLALLLRFFLFGLIRALARRSENEIDDVVLDVSRRPLLLTLTLLGLIFSLEALRLEETFAGDLRRWLTAGLVVIITYWAWRLVKEVVIHYGEQFARRSETRLDDVLLPIVNQFAPLALFLIGGSIALQYLGVRLDALLVAIGGAAFILAFALQDILSNVFSGLSLLVDTPFRYGDLITLEGGQVCQVVKIGVRVTQLYDIHEHAVIYMPNSKLANERLVNLMQPTPELFSSLRLEIDRQADVELVLQIVDHVLDGHPDVLGVPDKKLPAVSEFSVLSPAKQQNGVERLQAEQRLDHRLLAAAQALHDLAEDVARKQAGGLSRSELAAIRADLDPVLNQLGRLPNLDRRLGAYRGGIELFLQSIIEEVGAASLAGVTWDWVGSWAADPDLEAGVDDVRLRAEGASRILSLLRRAEDLRQRVQRLDMLELRLDDNLLNLSRWLLTAYKQPVPPWKCSGVSFKGFQDGGLNFSVYFLVDNIELEHFFRQARVEAQVRREISRRFREAGIEFASPRHQVAFTHGAPRTDGQPGLTIPLPR